MEYTFVGCASPKIATQISLRLASAAPDRHRLLGNTSPDDAVGARLLEKSAMCMEPPARGVAGVLAQEFRHHQLDVGAFGDEMSVPAVMVDQIIVHADGAPGPHRHRFLPCGEVHGAVDLAHGIELVCDVFEVADCAHGSVEFDEMLVGKFQAARLDTQAFFFRGSLI
jgi:hypothetical protein